MGVQGASQKGVWSQPERTQGRQHRGALAVGVGSWLRGLTPAAMQGMGVVGTGRGMQVEVAASHDLCAWWRPGA